MKMDFSTIENFNTLINTNCSLIFNQSIEDESHSYKRLKLDCSTNPATNEVAQKLVIDQLLEECSSKNLEIKIVVKQFLCQQFRDVISLYKDGHSFKMKMSEVTAFIKALVARDLVPMYQLSQLLSSSPEMNFLPLNFIWYLSQVQVISFEQVINRIKNTENAGRLIEDALSLMLRKMEDESADLILTDLVRVLITISYDLVGSQFEDLQQASSQLLLDLLYKFLESIASCSPSKEGEKKSSPHFVNIYELLLKEKNLSDTTVHQFLSSQLICVLTFKPEVRLSYAIQYQNRWRSTNSNQALSQVLSSIIKGIGHEEAFNTLDKVVVSLEVNWSHLLTFLGRLLLAHPNSANKLKAVVDAYVRKGCSLHETELLILGFLFARHAAMEGRHVFPSYSHWFGATFGSESSSPANTKQTFVFLMQFLTSLVPYESPSDLRAHLHQSVFVPKGCQPMFRDYQRLARVRLQDLDENPLVCLNTGEGKQVSNATKTETEVQVGIEQFAESGTVPSFVLEAAIFRRPHFLSSFMPSLLAPRCLPDPPDPRMKFIDKLVSLSKIPDKTRQVYLHKCREMAEQAAAHQPGKAVDNGDSSCASIASLTKCLAEYKDVMKKEEEEEGAKTPRLMLLLSKLSQSIEEMMAVADVKLEVCSSLTVHWSEPFDPELTVNQMVSQFFATIEELVVCGGCDGVRKLVALFAASPAFQSAFLHALLRPIQALEQKKRSSQKQMKFVGVLLCELTHLTGMLLPVRLSTDIESALSSPADLLLRSLPLNDDTGIYFSCCVLNYAITWSSVSVESQRCGGEESALKKVKRVYAFAASRVLASPLDDTGLVARVGGEDLPLCCRAFSEDQKDFQISFDDWLELELETRWGQTPLHGRVKHLKLWFERFFAAKRDDESPKSGFLLLFWKLVRNGVRKENCAELFVLLQSLAFETRCSFSLLDEWRNWKKTFEPQTDDETKHQKQLLYQKNLAVFLGLCHALPRSLFISSNSTVAILKLLKLIIRDILEMESSLYLNVGDCKFLLECFLEATHRLHPSVSHTQECFDLLRDSVLFHIKSMDWILKRHSPVVEQYKCFSSLMNVRTCEATRFKSTFGPRDSAILLSSSFGWPEGPPKGPYCLWTTEHSRPFALLYVTLNLGHKLLTSGKKSRDSNGGRSIVDRLSEKTEDPSNLNLDSDSNSDSVSDFGLLVETNDEEIVGMMEAASSLLGGLKVASNSPLSLMSDWKAEAYGLSPLFWKCFLLGFTRLLLTQMEEEGSESREGQRAAWLLSLLFYSFNSMAKQFDKSESVDSESPSLDYLSHLNCRIHAIVKKIPPKHLELIPEAVLRICDKELLAALKFRCTKR